MALPRYFRKPVQVGPEVIAKKGLLPMIEVNLDLVDNQIRFQPQVSESHRVVSLHAMLKMVPQAFDT